MGRHVPFLDLRISDASERREYLSVIENVFDHGRILLGPEVEELEHRVAERCGRAFAVGVNSGTDALYLALRATGVGPGDEVITTAFSWIATANAIRLTGATPVFADIREDLNIDPVSVAALITERTKGLLPVHYTGKVCRMPELQRLADRYGLWILEDAAQAFDAKLDGRRAGSFGLLAAFSMNPMKVFAALGEAGMVLTDREDLRERLISLRYNGTIHRETCVEPSLNGRLDTLQAAILLKRLARMNDLMAQRRTLAHAYTERLAGVVELPLEADGEEDVFYTYTIRTPHRDALMAHLETCGIETKIRHPILMPEQPAYQPTAMGQWKNAQRLIKQILCLPIHEKLSLDDIDYTADCIRSFFRAKGTF